MKPLRDVLALTDGRHAVIEVDDAGIVALELPGFRILVPSSDACALGLGLQTASKHAGQGKAADADRRSSRKARR